ncbi:MAG: glycosyltransferase [Sporomusaceae bacterium]|nr:glycosyltransferase [Sporomusaceae bacterium]
MTVRISLCMIAKNEEQNIGRCLQSVTGVVDEIIIVDTGSSDNTCQIAQGFGAKVQSFTWNDNFSDARNASLDLATGDWILFLDADEELAKGSGATLQSAVLEPKIEGYFIKIINVAGDDRFPENSEDMVFRLFRNKKSYRFKGAVHEQICDAISEKNEGTPYQFIEDAVIYHYGYLNSHIEAKDKKKRNRVLLERELIHKPDDLLVRFHYGVELYRMEEYLLAIQEFEKIVTKVNPKQIIYGPKLVRYIVLAYKKVQELRLALHALQQGLALFPDYADLYHLGGITHYELREYGLAYEYFQKAVQAPKQPVHYASFYGMQGYRSYYYLGEIAEKFCNEEAALGYYIDSLRDNNNFTAALNRIIPILQPRSDPDYAQYAINKICDLSLPQARLLIGSLMFNHSAYTAALTYFEVVPHELFTTQFILHKAICLIQLRRSAEAVDLLDSISEEDTVAFDAQFNQLLCFLFEGNQQKVRTTGEKLVTLGRSADTVQVIELLMNRDSKQKPLKSISSEGMTLLLEIVKRTLDLSDIELCSRLLSGVSSQSLAEYCFQLGELFYQYGHFSLAEEYLNQYIEQNSEEPAAYLRLAEIKEGQELYVEAIAYYQQALHCDPKEPSYYIKLIKVYEKLRSKLLKQVVEKYPEFPIISTLLEEVGAGG